MQDTGNIADSDRIVRRQDLLSAAIENELTVMDIQSGRYYGMNAMAARIWAMLEAPKTMAELCTALMQSFDVDAATCRREVEQFLGEMTAQGLVNVENGDGD